MLTRVEIEGFKSIGAPGLALELSRLNFLVGPNASGKTNFISALRFLQNAIRQDSEFATNELGGISEVRNKLQRERKERKPLRIRVQDDVEIHLRVPNEKDEIRISDFDYTLTIDLRGSEKTPTIIDESLSAYVCKDGRRNQYALKRNETEVTINDPISTGDASLKTYPVPDPERSRPALSVGFFSMPCVLFKKAIEQWSFYNVSPHVARQSYKEMPEAVLGTLGENLSVVLHKLEKQNGTKRLDPIVASLRGAVPGLKDVKSVKLSHDGRWALSLHEEKIRGAISPSSISDGTIRLLALMVIANVGAERRTLITIEEPENGVHPHLSEHIVSVLRDTSRNSQVIATTHNPAFLDHLKAEEVLMCGKIDGFTRIKRADSLAEIDSFQKHFSLGDLWVQGTLDGVLG